MMDSVPLVPWWIALPMGSLALVVLAAKLVMLGGAEMDERRRRLRAASTALLMLAAALFSYGVGVATPSRPRMYVLVWVLVSSILLMVILLASLDLLHTARLHRQSVRDLRQRIAAARAEALQGAKREGTAGGAEGSHA